MNDVIDIEDVGTLNLSKRVDKEAVKWECSDCGNELKAPAFGKFKGKWICNECWKKRDKETKRIKKSEDDINFKEAAERMAKVVKESAVEVEELGKYLRLAHENAECDAVKAAGAGRRLRKYLNEGISIEEVKALYEKKRELKDSKK